MISNLCLKISVKSHNILRLNQFHVNTRLNSKSLESTCRMIPNGHSYILSEHEMEALLSYSKSLNNGLEMKNTFIPFVDVNTHSSSNVHIGYIEPNFWNIIKMQSNVLVQRKQDDKAIITFHEDILEKSHSNISYKSQILSDAFSEVTSKLKTAGHIKGWRNELVSVVTRFSSEPVFSVERAAYPYFGFRGYGVHLNGFIRDIRTGAISHLWVAKRSATKSTWPGMLDHIAAGGQPLGLKPFENLLKEAEEEAGIPFKLSKSAKSVGAVSYTSFEAGQLKRDVLFCFDLELEKEFLPVAVDGEVESFQLESIDWILRKVIEGGPSGYKPNCNLVLIDFFIR